jgi:hypothetical protein
LFVAAAGDGRAPDFEDTPQDTALESLPPTDVSSGKFRLAQKRFQGFNLPAAT